MLTEEITCIFAPSRRRFPTFQSFASAFDLSFGLHRIDLPIYHSIFGLILHFVHDPVQLMSEGL
jgi:hypothetical protein